MIPSHPIVFIRVLEAGHRKQVAEAKVRVGRHIRHDAGNIEFLVIKTNRSAQGRLITKYFLLSVCVRTILFGAVNAVFGSPSRSWKLKTLKVVESAYRPRFS